MEKQNTKTKRLLLSTIAISTAIEVGIVVVLLNALAVPKPVHVQIAASCKPCAAKNPCNPCGACNRCGASVNPVEIIYKEAQDTYNCLKTDVVSAYSNTGNAIIKNYTIWKKFNSATYLTVTHGRRYLNNYAKKAATTVYGKYENLKKHPSALSFSKMALH